MANAINSSQGVVGVSTPTAAAPSGGAAAYLAGKADQVLGRDHHTDAPKLADAQPLGGDATDSKTQQANFVQAMQARGIQASNPPSEAQLKSYFAKFNDKDHRSEALGQFESYSKAFNIHEASVPGHENEDISYHTQQIYERKGKFFDSKADAEKGGDYNDTTTVAPDNWADVTSNRTSSDGRKMQDCKGFAYVSQDLLGAAGYQVKQVATQDGEGNNGHAMTLLTDPVTSNDKTFTGGNANQLLQKGYDYANGKHVPARGFYYGDTVSHAEARMGFDNDPKAVH